jgi:hypothetical protein
MAQPPFLQHFTPSDHVQERLLTAYASDGAAVVMVEVPVHRNAAAFSESDGFFDLAALEITLFGRVAR